MKLVFLSSPKYSHQQLIYTVYLLNKLVVAEEYKVGSTLNYPRCQNSRYELMRFDCVKSKGKRACSIDRSSTSLNWQSQSRICWKNVRSLTDLVVNPKCLLSSAIGFHLCLSFLICRIRMIGAVQVYSEYWRFYLKWTGFRVLYTARTDTMVSSFCLNFFIL